MFGDLDLTSKRVAQVCQHQRNFLLYKMRLSDYLKSHTKQHRRDSFRVQFRSQSNQSEIESRRIRNRTPVESRSVKSDLLAVT